MEKEYHSCGGSRGKVKPKMSLFLKQILDRKGVNFKQHKNKTAFYSAKNKLSLLMRDVRPRPDF